MLLVEPEDVECLLNLAAVDTRLHHYTQALHTLNTVLSLEPDHREALYRSAQLLYDNQRYQESILALRRLNRLEPTGYKDSLRLLRTAHNRTTNTNMQN